MRVIITENCLSVFVIFQYSLYENNQIKWILTLFKNYNWFFISWKVLVKDSRPLRAFASYNKYVINITIPNPKSISHYQSLRHVSLSHRRLRPRNEPISSTFFCISSGETLTKSMGRVGYRKLLLVFPCPTRRHPPNSVLIFSYRPRIT